MEVVSLPARIFEWLIDLVFVSGEDNHSLKGEKDVH
jgi:hypothetical protein